ncbi:hypothetical protein ACFWWM_16490 [Streptomyces sp. NPDC058682]|uniref:hypothetical protein n=1 Tax=Streptomyces sp. NPDC058682 TaxID=3346596 RepID=UPI00365C4D51
MSTQTTALTQQLGTTPRETDGIIARSAVPAIQQAPQRAGIAAAVYPAGANERRDGQLEGLVHISLGSADAYEPGRWLEAHGEVRPARGHADREHVA